MSEAVERLVFYILGIVGGVAIAMVLGSFGIGVMLSKLQQDFCIICGLVGLIVAIIYYEYHQEKIMRENSRLRNEAVTLITHEMRTGLTSTSWAIQLVLQGYGEHLKPDDKKMLENVVSSIHTTVMHSVNLLDISLLDVKKLLIALQWVSLEKVSVLLKDTLDKYIFGADRKGIKLSSSIKLNGARQVEVDVMRLRVVLENLLENAFQYLKDSGDRRIDVDIRNDKENLYIVVADNGIGIPAVEQEKIFEQFYRAANARRKLSNGSGIGLFMCKQYVTAHRGTISFNSKEGQGTTFNISIPLRSAVDVNDFLEKV